ncbi:hypothetical protein LTR10_009832 [Elasticomyces elasticus]|nr:hypothetical protein LTR10_009832 [Elasticomyces elasticus]KAK4970122.1 hypothetical protein LTR42_008289 [Elasticomyces elasticus]
MNAFLLSRQLGSTSPQALTNAHNHRLLQALQLAPNVHFSLVAPDENEDQDLAGSCVAHAAGVNSIAIDRFEGRYLLSGGADSSVAIWDLETPSSVLNSNVIHTPLGQSARTSTTERFGITQVSFYPFDSLAFLTSGYDRTLKLFSSETLVASAVFDLESTVHAHATSNVATTHLLVACASQHPAVRLVDLKSGISTHSLAGHSGSVLSVAWHPKNENILASGATDGTCRLWDIRRSASSLGVLDMDDSIGVVGYDGKGLGARRRERGKAHNGAVNGITWSEDCQHLVTTGLDERMRVWNMQTGANTLANFGPSLKNTHNTLTSPLLPPSILSAARTIYYPNAGEILCFDMHSGKLLKRLRAPQRTPTASRTVHNLNTRTTSLAWRAHDIEMYSAHSDGTIRCWRPRTTEDIEAEEEEACHGDDPDGEDGERKRKRDELDQIVRDLTKKRAT